LVREPSAPRAFLDNPAAVAALARQLILDDAREHFLILCLNAQNRLIASHEISVGTLTASLVSSREVLVRRSASSAPRDPAVKAERQEREARAVLLMNLGGTPGALLALLLTVVDAGRVNWRELHRLAVVARLMPQ
jgi:hypothetical protein